MKVEFLSNCTKGWSLNGIQIVGKGTLKGDIVDIPDDTGLATDFCEKGLCKKVIFFAKVETAVKKEDKKSKGKKKNKKVERAPENKSDFSGDFE